MTNQKMLERYTGFTEDEVKELCERFDMDFDGTSSWHDRYMFKKYQHIYNPRSVVEAMRWQDFSNYWTSTETYETLKIYMDMDFDGLRSDITQLLGGDRVRVNTRSFQNDMRNFRTKDDILTLLIHLGYLGYDARNKEVFIPNKEIIEEYENAMSVGGWSEVMRVMRASEKLLEYTLNGDAESVPAALDQAHTEIASILTYNNENSLGAAIGLAYYSARKDYRLIRELPTPSINKPAFIVELKYDKTAQSALQQIKDRQYTQALEGYAGELLLVGINYNKEEKAKPHSCVIEKHSKR